MKNKNNKVNMKKIMKMAFAVVAFAAVGLGSYRAYGSYTAANMSEEDLLMQENIEAMAIDGYEGTPPGVTVECKTKPHKGGGWPGVNGNGKRHICETKYASEYNDAKKYMLECSYYGYPSYSSGSYSQYCYCILCGHYNKDLPACAW